MIFYGFFLCLFFSATLLLVNIPMKFASQNAIRDAILHPIYAIDPDLNVENLTTRRDFINYLKYAFPDMF